MMQEQRNRRRRPSSGSRRCRQPNSAPEAQSAPSGSPKVQTENIGSSMQSSILSCVLFPFGVGVFFNSTQVQATPHTQKPCHVIKASDNCSKLQIVSFVMLSCRRLSLHLFYRVYCSRTSSAVPLCRVPRLDGPAGPRSRQVSRSDTSKATTSASSLSNYVGHQGPTPECAYSRCASVPSPLHAGHKRTYGHSQCQGGVWSGDNVR